MLKPDFPKKGMGKEKWKERKGRNGKKEKERRWKYNSWFNYFEELSKGIDSVFGLTS